MFSTRLVSVLRKKKNVIPRKAWKEGRKLRLEGDSFALITWYMVRNAMGWFLVCWAEQWGSLDLQSCLPFPCFSALSRNGAGRCRGVP